jgi:Uncharacterized conserved protein
MTSSELSSGETAARHSRDARWPTGLVTLSGSPRMAPGLDENRAPADKRADGLGVIDPSARKLIDRWHVGSDPEQFAISKDGKFAFIANEDDASHRLSISIQGNRAGE